MNLPTRRLTGLLVGGAVIAAVAVTGAYFGYADPLGDSPVDRSVKTGSDPVAEPGNDPGPIFTGPSATPRPCPECFANLPTPAPASPCPQRPLVNAGEVDFGQLRAPATDGWIRYQSPNYPFSFLYPPGWDLRTHYSDVYGWQDLPGFITQIRGPVTESIKIINPVVAAQDTGAQMGIEFAAGSAMIEMTVGPNMASAACEPAAEGNPRSFQTTVAGVEAPAVMNVVEPPDSGVIRYVVTVSLDPAPLQRTVVHGYSFGDPSGLEVLKAVLASMGVGP